MNCCFIIILLLLAGSCNQGETCPPASRQRPGQTPCGCGMQPFEAPGCCPKTDCCSCND